MIRLYTTFYQEIDAKRRDEYSSCISRNLTCKAIDQVVIINENDDLFEFNMNKLNIIHFHRRPTYNDYFELINRTSSDSDISIIANTDIYFDHNISVLNQINFNNRCFALSRWDIMSDGKSVLYEHNDSQDIWIFKGRIRKVKADFFVGMPRCDNRIAYELEKAGYLVENPSFSIKSYHLHAGKREKYSKKNLPGYIPPPYKYIWPHNLFSLPTTLWHNLTHPQSKVSYRIDKRKVDRWIVVRAFRKLSAILSNKKAK